MKYHDFKFYDVYYAAAQNFDESLRAQFLLGLVIYGTGGTIDAFPLEIQNAVHQVFIEERKPKRKQPKEAVVRHRGRVFPGGR